MKIIVGILVYVELYNINAMIELLWTTFTHS